MIFLIFCPLCFFRVTFVTVFDTKMHFGDNKTGLNLDHLFFGALRLFFNPTEFLAMV